MPAGSSRKTSMVASDWPPGKFPKCQSSAGFNEAKGSNLGFKVCRQCLFWFSNVKFALDRDVGEAG